MARRPRQRAHLPWLAAAALATAALATAALATAAGCGFDADYTGATITCADVDPQCPDGYQCVAGICRTTAPPPIDAAGPDASVCELAAQQPDNDRCAAAIDVAVTTTEVERYGDTAGYANDLAPSVLPGCTGSPEPGPDAVYRLALTAGDTLHAELRTTSHDGAIYLLDGCSLTATCRGGADALGAGAIDQATIAITTTGTYYLVVDASSAGAAGCYALRMSITR